MAGTRILALDPGSKRIGVALSDELGWTAQPLETYVRRSVEADVAYIQDLVRLHNVREVIMGLPIRLDGRVGPEAKGVQQLIETLQQALKVPVVAWDERFTTKSAEKLLLDAKMSRMKRKRRVDRVAAAVLLQSYLECQVSGAKDPDHERWGDA